MKEKMEKVERMIKTNGFRSLASDSFWTIFSQVFIVFVNLASVYILANLLTQHNYGEFKLITTWLAIALGVGYTGYAYLLPQKITRGEKYDLKEIFFKTFVKSLPAFVGLFVISLYYLYNQNFNLGSGFFFAGLLAPVLCVSALVNTYYMGRKNFKMFALAQNFVDIVQLAIIAFFAYFFSNFVVIVSAYFIGTLLANMAIVLRVLYEDKKLKHNFSNIVKEVETMTDEKIESKMRSKLNLSAIVLGFTNQIDKLLIFHFIGAVPLAVYAIVTAMSDQARTPIKAIAAAIFPRMTAHSFTKKKLVVAYVLLTLLSIIGVVILFILYPYIFKYLFPKYVEYIYLANIASLTILFAPSQLLYLYSQSKNDLETLNTYANLNTILQVVLFCVATYLQSIVVFLVCRAFIMFVSTVYQFVRIYKN